jgi:hypothetical protein
MNVLVIYNWPEITSTLAQSLATTLGVTAFDARQRLVCKSPIVVSIQADPRQAEILLKKLQQGGFNSFVVDVDDANTRRQVFDVHTFKFAEDSMALQESGNRKCSITYKDIKLALPASRIRTQAEVNTVTERKFSMGKTLMAGGLPMTKKVERQEMTTNEKREKVLYLCGTGWSRVICAQDMMRYECFGEQMNPTREMNFNLFVSEIRQRCPAAVYDDRLLKRAEQVKLLGPLLDPDSYIDLAVDIMCLST